MYVRMYACMYVKMYVCMFVCMFVCMYVCKYVCIYASLTGQYGLLNYGIVRSTVTMYQYVCMYGHHAFS